MIDLMPEWLEAHQLPCLFRGMFGIECPGCGFQTALIYLLRGELILSVKTYPALLPVILFCCLSLARFCGIKKIGQGVLKFLGFVCLLIILISYLLKLCLCIK